MKEKSIKKHKTPAEMMQRISIEVEDEMILNERGQVAAAKFPDSPFKGLFRIFKNGEPVETSKEKAERGIK